MSSFLAVLLVVALLCMAVQAATPDWSDCGDGKALATQTAFSFDKWVVGSDFHSQSTFVAAADIEFEGNWTVETTWVGWTKYTDKQTGANKNWGDLGSKVPFSAKKGETFIIKNEGTFKSDLPAGTYTSYARIYDQVNNLIFCAKTKWTF